MSATRSDLNRFAASIATVLVGSGIIALVVYFFDVDLLVSVFLWVLAPIMLFGFAVGLVGWGTITALFNGALKDRIIEHYEAEKAKAAAEAAA